MLFLDELPEFNPQVLDALRQPLEAGETVIARANHRITYPSRIQLIAAMNPCRCGTPGSPALPAVRDADARNAISPASPAQCSTASTSRSEVPAVSVADLVLPQAAEGSAEMRARVTAARQLQTARYVSLGLPKIRTNAECDGAALEDIAAPSPDGLRLLRDAAESLALSARGYHRTLRVARTLADLDGEAKVARIHIAEALSYRGETLRRAQAAA